MGKYLRIQKKMAAQRSLNMNNRVVLEILQYNCGRSMAAMNEMGKVMEEEEIDVALVQEPWTAFGKVCGLPSGFKIMSSEDCKAAIIVSCPDKIQSVQLTQYVKISGACAHLKGPFGEITVISTYCQFAAPIDPFVDRIEEVFRHFVDRPVLVGIDANAVSPLWYSKGQSSAESVNRGMLLEGMIFSNNIAVLNNPSRLFSFSSTMGQQDIDVTMANTNCCRNYDFEWKIRNAGLSDHNPIIVIVKAKCAIENYVPVQNRVWKTKNVEWPNYIDAIRNEIAALEGVANANEKADKITSVIANVNDRLLKRIVPIKRQSDNWWNGRLKRMRCKVRRLRNQIQLARSRQMDIQELLINHRRERGLYVRAIREAKQTHWSRFVTESTMNDPWGAAYRFCRGKSNAQQLCALRDDRVMTTTWNESVQLLLTEFFPRDRVNRCTADEVVEIGEEDVPFTLEEVATAVDMNSRRKAPGLDAITAEMVRYVNAAVPDTILDLFESCRRQSTFPVKWKEAKLIILLKSSEKEKEDPRSYRPISLLPVLGKTLERLMVGRLHAVTNGQMNDGQYGFRKGRGTEDALNKLKTTINANRTKYVLGIFIDFKGAFDNLRWGSILDKLQEYRCREINLWKSYFSDRRACVVGEAETVWASVRRGCPQGSICGPAMWNMVMNDLLVDLTNDGFCAIAYADDLVVLVEESTRILLEEKGRRVAEAVLNWGERVGVSINTEKSVNMMLKGRFNNRPPTIRLAERTIKNVKSVRYLGITISECLSIKLHMLNSRKKLANLTGMLQRVFKRKYCITRRSMNLLYTGVLTPCGLYGASYWSCWLQKKFARDHMERCERVALSLVLNVCRTVSTEAMQVINGSLPWDLLALVRAASYKVKKGIPLTAEDRITSAEVALAGPKKWKDILEERLFDEWQERWENSEKGRTTFEWIPDVRFGRSHPQFYPSMELGYLLTGHGSMNAFLFARTLTESPNCRCGYGEEDWRHVLAVCPRYDDIRDLSAMGIVVAQDGSICVKRALDEKVCYDALGRYSAVVFQRRKEELSHADQ